MTVQSFEAIVAQYGIPNCNGDMLTEQAALSLFSQLKRQESMPIDGVDYHISHVRIEGNRERGKVIAIFEFGENKAA